MSQILHRMRTPCLEQGTRADASGFHPYLPLDRARKWVCSFNCARLPRPSE